MTMFDIINIFIMLGIFITVAVVIFKTGDDKTKNENVDKILDFEKRKAQSAKRQEDYDKLINEIDANLKNKKEIYDKRKQELYNSFSNRPNNDDPTGKRD